jgi:DNA-binding NtrC family response regulator
MSEKILVVDDDENLLTSLKKILRLEHYCVDTLINARQVEEQVSLQEYQCILLDVRMPVIDGMDVLKTVQQINPRLPVIMISGQSDIETAITSIKNGAYDFIEKPVNPERLFIAVKNAIQRYSLQVTSDAFFRELQDKFSLVGQSKALKFVVQQINDVSETLAKVLILGESGTGKELVARAIHFQSLRKGKPFIKLNCATIPAELLESELFGHRKGSFTGAVSDRMGKFAEADGGTLFLDEIGDMSLQLQSKLLRVLEESEIEVIGENLPRKVDVRIIAATNCNLEEMVGEGRFREDLYYRLNVVKISIPPLRERPDDILPLAYNFLKEFNDVYNKQITGFKNQTETLLINFSWPGNVRQLRNAVEKMVIFSRGSQIGYEEAMNALEIAPENVQFPNDENNGDSLNLKHALHEFERNYIIQVLQKNDGKVSATAEALGIDRSNLFKKMRRYHISE